MLLLSKLNKITKRKQEESRKKQGEAIKENTLAHGYPYG